MSTLRDALAEMRSQAEDRRFQFHYGPHQEVGELVLRSSPWHSSGGTAKPLGTLVIPNNGTWTRITSRLVPGPDSLVSHELLRQAEKASGLRLAFRAVPWKPDGEMMTRAVVVSGSEARLKELFPPWARA